ncbi:MULTISPECIES: YHYH domain-containing protein [unclassified Pseudoalteromonas]|uniref:YHYH domain-containing protein n=1 Tax=unclassified Pseudoalteromonas TaxID=194690 RepID=UPI000CF72C15|nr:MULTISPECIES: YHYH domain-containing protein [unclassified Pseudoalteromonas]TMO25579.1 YHYH domain-containing protein [Pseudoalteromonas sp. S4492]
MNKVKVLLAVALLVSSGLSAHSGRTNASGCHTNHSNGSYHCHNKKRADKQTYCHILKGEKRCGYAYSTCQSLKKKYGGACELSY